MNKKIEQQNQKLFEQQIELTYYINSYIFVSFGQITSFYIIKLLN